MDLVDSRNNSRRSAAKERIGSDYAERVKDALLYILLWT
jgi:hypothetical protein